MELLQYAATSYEAKFPVRVDAVCWKCAQVPFALNTVQLTSSTFVANIIGIHIKWWFKVLIRNEKRGRL